MNKRLKLIEEITQRSESKDWANAKNEWSFLYIYYSKETQKCLCTQQIHNICVIKNKINGVITEVGNECVNQFLGITTGDNIILSIQHLRKDKQNSLNMHALDYLLKNNVITTKDYDFYKNIRLKRNLSQGRLKWKLDINQKFTNFTSYEFTKKLQKINDLIDRMENRNSNTDFIKSVKENFILYGNLTEKQRDALNIIYKQYNTQ
ncbi:hypothetical protein [Empedobacter brevis]|uniref:hypothetical protein n=1 Tax=Empedobacter brevis TaxID=247 RepID=UPI00333FDC5A